MGRGFGSVKKSDGFNYTGRLKPGILEKKKFEIPPAIKLPDYAVDGIPKAKTTGYPWEIIPQTKDDIDRMRVAGRIAREVLDAGIRAAKVGVTTIDIDLVVYEETIKRNSYPSPLNYNGFPRSCCTSINEVICHGIPDTTELMDGDIINIDVTVYFDGVHGDCSETIFIGNVPEKTRDLVKTTYESLNAAIAYCKPGAKYNEIGGIIEDIIIPKGYKSVRAFCGNGIGRIFHTTPNILHYRNSQRLGIMAPGHTFTIEPMICLGSAEYVMWPDKWTATTTDGLPSAQFEHTLLITETGVDILTQKSASSPKYSWE